METLTSLLSIFTIVFLLVYSYSKWIFTFWKRHGVHYIEPEFPYGNVRAQFKSLLSFGDQFSVFYNHFKSKGLKGGGVYIFVRPVFVPVDLELIKNILQKDFNSFVNHGLFFNEKADPLTGHLFNLENEKWRYLRAKLTPTFTSGKMKMMFQTFVECTTGLEDILKEHCRIQDVVNIKDVVSRFTTDIIGSCAFGIDCNSLKNPDSEFRQFGNKIFEPGLKRRMKSMLFLALPRKWLISLGVKSVGSDIEKFFMDVVRKTVEYRETNNVQRKDFMQLLLQLKNQGIVSDDDNLEVATKPSQDGQALTLNELAAQCFVFFLAGFETSATTMTFALLELAQDQGVQKKLRDEIETVLKKYDGKICYDAVMEMTYLDKVIYETLRKHPPVPGTPRVCNKEYKIEGTDIVLKPGMTIHIPFQAIQRDPEYFPDPEKFDPQRFSEVNKATRPQLTFLAFGEGPRICIGARFGLLQAKVGLLSIIRKFKVTLNQKTQTPIKYATKAFITSVQGGVWLNVERIDNLIN